MTSGFQDGCHDVRLPLAAACSSIRRLPASSPIACDVIGSLCALQLQIRIIFVRDLDIFCEASRSSN